MKRACMLFVLMATLLCGCTKVHNVPYIRIADGVYAVGDEVWDHGVKRERMPNEQQALQFVTDDKGVDLVGGDLAFYTGTLYSLSNYRLALLDNGYTVSKEVRTHDLMDTTLKKDKDRIRLIYQRSGTIRILFEKSRGERHIVMEGR